jgi:hypothetical protein
MLKACSLMAKILLLLPGIAASFFAHAQPVEQLLAKAKASGANEAIYLHTDKMFFLPGETIWFNAFAFAGKEAVTDKSILVVNLIASKNHFVESKKMLLINGTAASYFVLPVNDSNSYYYLQAYTSGMIALDSSNIYTKQIFLKNNCNQYETGIVENDPVQFFIEGDGVVDGFTNTIAFKIPPAGKSEEIISGIVEDENGVEATSFTSTFEGMGKFELLTEEGKNYFAVFEADGKKNKIPLNLKRSTVNTLLNIYPVAGGLVYRIRSMKPGKFQFVAQADYNIRYKAIVDIENSLGFAKFLPDSILGPGINHMVLLDDKNRVMAQRLYFNEWAKMQNSPRVHIENALTNAGELIVQLDNMKKGNYSIAITNAAIDPGFEKDNMPGQVKFSALKSMPSEAGRISEILNDSIRKRCFDLLMLTNFSTRYDMNRINALYNNKIVDDGEEIKTLGQLSDAEKNRVLKNEELTIFIKQADTLRGVVQTTSDNNGMVKLPSLILEDSATVYFRQLKDRYPKYMLKITPARQAPIIKKEIDFFIKSCDSLLGNTSAEINKIKLWNKETEIKMMQNITLNSIKKSNRQLMEEKYVSPWFNSLSNERGNFDFINDYTGITSGNVIDFLKNRIMVNGSGEVSGYNMILNESVVDKNIMYSINMSDIAYIKIMGSNFIPPVSPYIPGEPTLIVYTKKGEDNTNGTMGVFKEKIAGFATTKAYYNPVFENGMLPGASRGTLYWNSSVKPEITKTLYCKLMNTTAKSIRVILQGVDENGDAVYFNRVYNF